MGKNIDTDKSINQPLRMNNFFTGGFTVKGNSDMQNKTDSNQTDADIAGKEEQLAELESSLTRSGREFSGNEPALNALKGRLDRIATQAREVTEADVKRVRESFGALGNGRKIAV